uniref:Dehydrogenase/reductase SDR family member 1 n=1 Tax=Sphenodon punctatus TaxID=8508 RepID=A0A8D0HM50_SPHPU
LASIIPPCCKSRPLLGQVCLVTGASRGIGNGIALQLSEAGATVYITGRHQESLEQAAEEVQCRGGHCVPVVCDSTQEKEVEALFQRLKKEQKGRLDVLVNNAFSEVPALLEQKDVPFWERPVSLWDNVNNVGLRGHYIYTFYAARMMVPAKHGLIVIISSIGGLRYLFSVPYGVGKAACDRLAADCAVELRSSGVACVALWPGLVRTEEMEKKTKASGLLAEKLQQRMVSMAESTEVSGKCIVALASDPHIMRHTGKVLLSPDLARRYRFKDVDGRPVFNYTSIRTLLMVAMPKLSFLFSLIPECITTPKWVLSIYGIWFIYQTVTLKKDLYES